MKLLLTTQWPVDQPGRAKALTLFRIWSSTAIIAFLLVMTFYTLFFGRNKVVLNSTIYENYRFVGFPGAAQLTTEEGYGLTSFGEDGLIVNKRLDMQAFRVLFFGDSFVKAKQVSDHEKFTEVVEREWNIAHPRTPIQALNLGLGGQDMSTYLSFSKNMDKRFRPQLVFLMVSRVDFASLERVPKKLALLHSMTEPLVKPDKSSALHEVINQLGFRSFFGQLQAQTYGFLSQGKATAPVEAAEETRQTSENAALALQLQRIKEIWGDRLVLIYRNIPENLGRGAAPTNEDDALGEIKKQGIRVLDLYPLLLPAFQERKPPTGFNNSILGAGHLNQYGHQLVAREIIKLMETMDDLF